MTETWIGQQRQPVKCGGAGMPESDCTRGVMAAAA
jgi:hypothetical protein